MKESNALSNLLLITSQLRRTKLKCTSHTLLVNIRKSVSKRLVAQLPRDLSIRLWLEVEDQVVRSRQQLESLNKLSKWLISLLVKTPSKSFSRLSYKVEQERTLQELVLEVLLEDKQLMSHLLEEWTKLFTLSVKDQESHVSEVTRVWLKL
jgi:hypothetical protein